MQNAAQRSATDNPKIEKVSVNHRDIGNSPSTPHSSNSSPAKSETDTYSERRHFMSDTSESEEDSVSEVESFVIDQEFEEDPQVEAAKFLLSPEADRSVDPETQARLEALLQAAGIGQLTTKDGKLADPEVLRRLTSSVSCALDEAAAALTRMRTDNPRAQPEKTSIVEATVDGDVRTVRKLLGEGRSVHETSEEGESLLSLACSAGYFELAQVLLAMHANVEDRGIKGECTPLMEAASAGHLDIVRLLVAHGADVNAQSSSGNTPLMYGCAGGHTDVVKFLLEHGANVEDHNENGHTPLMEAASAGHVELAKILLMHGAGINTHSNEFKESALTLACYKGHLDMVRFLLEAGADQEHKTDEMHTALMEASMDGHVEVARLLLDSGAQVNMPTDSFESPLTLAACGGHVDLAMLLIERGANIEEVNDEGYTPLMEAAREGHEEMVALLLSQGANINAQTDETQETALTLACCGGFSEVADFLIKAGADIELGASTPLMEAAQEGHLELVKYLLENNANVRAQTQTGDTALTYACENGHTDVADLLLQFGADLEHESEGGRTPLMKACRAGHLCTVQFLISKGADVNRQTTNNDHTPLSLACAGGHLTVVELLLAHRADPNHKLKDNSTMLIEAAKGGHTTVVQLLLDYPHSMMLSQQGSVAPILPGQVSNQDSPLPTSTLPQNMSQSVNFFQPSSNVTSPVLQEVPEAVRILPQEDSAQPQFGESVGKTLSLSSPTRPSDSQQKICNRKSALPKSLSSSLASLDAEMSQVALRPLSSNEVSQLTLRSQPLPLSEIEDSEFLTEDSPIGAGMIDFMKLKKQHSSTTPPLTDEGSTQKQQILEELHQVERDLHGKQQARNHLLLSQFAIPQEQCPNSVATTPLPHMLNLDIAVQQQQDLGTGIGSAVFPNGNLQVHNAFYTGTTCLQSPGMPLKLAVSGESSTTNFAPNDSSSAYYFSPLKGTVAVPLSSCNSNVVSQPIKFQTISSHAEVSQNTAISDRPKAKPAKKEGKNLRKQQQYQAALYGQQPQVFMTKVPLQQQQQPIQQEKPLNVADSLNVQGLDLDSIEQESLALKDDANLLTASILQQFHNSPQISTIRAAFVASAQRKTCLELFNRESESTPDSYLEQKNKELDKEDFTSDLVEDVVQTLESFNVNDVQNQVATQHNLQVQPYATALDESMIASLTPQHELTTQADGSRLEYFVPVSANGGQIPVQVPHSLYPYEHYLQTVATMSNKDETTHAAIYQAGIQAGRNIARQQLATSGEPLTNATITNTIETLTGTTAQQYVSSVQPACVPVQSACSHMTTNTVAQSSHHCQIPCSQHQHLLTTHQSQQQQLQQQQPITHQVQAATQTSQVSSVTSDNKKQGKNATVQDGVKVKKGRLLLRNQTQAQQGANFQPNQNQNYQIDSNSAITQYTANNQQCVPGTVPTANYCMDLDSETESNHDTALTLACAGGHEELVELLIKRGADIEHRDKKGFTPLILAATAGHEKIVEILLNNGADIEAQSERTKDTPLSLACSGGRYEVVELLLNRGANKEHRNVSDYTPLSLAASGGYVNIIKLLLNHAAEINSRTGSKLGISPLMLAAMNGHTAAVKLLLDKGSDINAQIETNRNTALTLACFQGRHEVVSLLLDRKANVEHRAKTGLTPLMEAASGGYVEVGRVLLDKGADVNATPVPSSRDTALTIAADKGHCRFVELLLCRGAAVEVKNKKGNSPLWLAANGGHLSVVELLYNLSADIDSQDNRKVSCLMAAFRKGHVKVVKWMVNHVTQYPSDQEMIRYISTVSDKELLEKCQECVKIIRAAKEMQAAKANKNASILLEELDMERSREESKKAAAARRRERKKKKKLEKREEKRRLTEENKKNEKYNENDDKDADDENDKLEDEENIPESESPIHNGEPVDKEEGDSGIDANSQGSCSSNDAKTKEKRKEKKRKKCSQAPLTTKKSEECRDSRSNTNVNQSRAHSSKEYKDINERRNDKSQDVQKNCRSNQSIKKGLIFESTRHPAERDDFEATGNDGYVTSRNKKGQLQHDHDVSSTSKTSPKQSTKRDEGWKEVVRKSSVQTVTVTDSGVKKVSVPLNAISRVIGRGGSNINAIRGATGAHIEVEKQCKGQGERIITLKGSVEATKQANALITTLIKDPDVDILQMLPKTNKLVATCSTSLWDKTQLGTKKITGKVVNASQAVTSLATAQQKTVTVITSTSTIPSRSVTLIKPRGSIITTAPRVTAPRLVAQAERNAAAQLASNTKNTMSYTTAIMTSRATTKIVTTTATQTFAAKLTETTTSGQIATNQTFQMHKSRPSQSLNVPHGATGPVSPQASIPTNNQNSPKHHRPTPTASAPPSMQHFQASGKFPSFSTPSNQVNICSNGVELRQTLSPVLQQSTLIQTGPSHVESLQATPISNITTTQEYSLFNSMAQQPTWRQETESHKPINFAAVTGGASSQAPPNKFVDNDPPPQVDASKAPGYRGGSMCSPVSSKTSSNSTTPPSLPLSSGSNYQSYPEQPKNQQLPPIGTNIMHNRSVTQTNQHDLSSNHYYGNPELSSRSMHLAHSDTNLYKTGSNSYQESMNMLNIPSENQQHLLSSYHQSNSMQHLNYSQSQQQSVQISATSVVSMSRLNPKAPDFSVHTMSNKPPQMYNGYTMNNQNSSLHGLNKSSINNYHRSAMSNPQQNRWHLLQMQQPFTPQQSELISGMAGMTLHSIARAAGGEILENGGDLGTVNSSPAMSPNLQSTHNLHSGDGHYIEDRKQPQPIGTERARKAQNPNLDSNWIMSNDSKMMVGRQWTSNNIERYPLLRNQMENDYISHSLDSFQHGVPLENQHGYASGAQFQTFLLQQQMATMRPLDFVPSDSLKMELPQWETSRPNMTDLQDKPHGWAGLTNKWNQ
ncbi:hypothetical protein FQA39_LY11258 [Lamprigera yunnana]|nr:hypothetical protein FQA39_LY11258 [Lamprigera yunnana]